MDIFRKIYAVTNQSKSTLENRTIDEYSSQVFKKKTLEPYKQMLKNEEFTLT